MATFYFVRHAKAGSRGDWSGDDRKRPLSSKGIEQADKLVTTLSAFPIAFVFSSPYLRCVQTVAPLARARGLTIERRSELAEGSGLVGAYAFMADASLDRAVLCTHGDVIWELVEDLANRRVLPAFREDFDKGSTWVVEVEDGSPVRARYISPP